MGRSKVLLEECGLGYYTPGDQHGKKGVMLVQEPQGLSLLELGGKDRLKCKREGGREGAELNRSLKEVLDATEEGLG